MFDITVHIGLCLEGDRALYASSVSHTGHKVVVSMPLQNFDPDPSEFELGHQNVKTIPSPGHLLLWKPAGHKLELPA